MSQKGEVNPCALVELPPREIQGLAGSQGGLTCAAEIVKAKEAPPLALAPFGSDEILNRQTIAPLGCLLRVGIAKLYSLVFEVGLECGEKHRSVTRWNVEVVHGLGHYQLKAIEGGPGR